MNDFSNRICICMKENLIKPVGGPRGYIYNLKTFFDTHHINNASYFKGDDPKKIKAVSAYSKGNGKVKNKLLKPARNFVCYGMPLLISRPNPQIESDNYRLLHFHSTLEMYRNRKSLKHYKGIVVLTSHTPMVAHKEIAELLSSDEKKLLDVLYKRLHLIDEYAFNRADYIIFPCKEAEDPYYHTWDKYADIKQRSQYKYRYLPTGICSCQAKVELESIRRQYGIPLDAIVFAFVGRHNKVKGYDRLIEIGENLLRKYPHVYFLVAGKPEPILPVRHPRWIEVGWTNDPYSIINAADIFVLPNRETYFDLVLLEALSLGKPILASSTGGNRFFKNCEGIILFESNEDCKNKMEFLAGSNPRMLEEMGMANKILFDKKFSIDVFGEKYVELINALMC